MGNGGRLLSHAPLARATCREIRHQHRIFWRNPTSVIFTVLLPVLTLPLLQAINEGALVRTLEGARLVGLDPPFPVTPGQPLGFVRFAQYLFPVAAAYGVAVASFGHLASRVAIARDRGILKRIAGTPLPASVYLAGLVGASVTISLLLVAGAVALGVIAYDVELVPRLLPAAVLTVAVGTSCFCALGLAVASLIPNAAAAPAVSYAILVPLGFLSSVFFPPQIAPQWMRDLGSLLPLQPFASALFASFSPGTPSPGIQMGDLAAVIAWGLAGAAVATRFGSAPED